MLAFVLGRCPADFGLIPDQNGYVKIKDLLKALGEEDGWRHIRRSSLDEVVFSLPSPVIELSEALVRATDRDQLPLPVVADNLPKRLYSCVRSRAYPVVFERGLSPTAYPYVIMSSDSEMATRLGRRVDPSPVLLEISVQKLEADGQVIFHAGGSLYYTIFVPTQCFQGPPLPPPAEDPKPKEKEKRPVMAKAPGSFFPDLGKAKSDHSARGKKGRKNDWKRDRKRKNREQQRPGEWG